MQNATVFLKDFIHVCCLSTVRALVRSFCIIMITSSLILDKTNFLSTSTLGSFTCPRASIHFCYFHTPVENPRQCGPYQYIHVSMTVFIKTVKVG